MIEKTTAYKTASGVFKTIEEAQRAEIVETFMASTGTDTTDAIETAADLILSHKEAILDILTMTASSKPRARKINGGKKTRKTLTAPAPNPNLAGIDR